MLKFLPPRASFAKFLGETEAIFMQLDWNERWAEVERLSHDWKGALTPEFPRTIYLRWLEEIVSSSSLTRTTHGDHPYSRVHLLCAEHAGGEQWSHRILAGLNEANGRPITPGPAFCARKKLKHSISEFAF